VVKSLRMAIVKLKIDVSGTVGDEAWRNLRQYEEIRAPRSARSSVQAEIASIPRLCLTRRANGSALKSGSKRRCSPSTLSRIIWNRTASSTPT
jgi:hypothetical protein